MDSNLLMHIQNMDKMPFFVGVQIQLLSATSVWNLPFKIRIYHRVIRIHSSHFSFAFILLIWIWILSIWIRILTLEFRFLSVLIEGFALGIRFIPETLSNLIRNNNISVLVSSKSNKGSTISPFLMMTKHLSNESRILP